MVDRISPVCASWFDMGQALWKNPWKSRSLYEAWRSQALIDKSQERVAGTVRVKLYKGSARVVARWSDQSLYSEKHVTFEEDAGAYDQGDAEGFIRLNALRLRLVAARNARGK